MDAVTMDAMPMDAVPGLLNALNRICGFSLADRPTESEDDESTYGRNVMTSHYGTVLWQTLSCMIHRGGEPKLLMGQDVNAQVALEAWATDDKPIRQSVLPDSTLASKAEVILRFAEDEHKRLSRMGRELILPLPATRRLPGHWVPLHSPAIRIAYSTSRRPSLPALTTAPVSGIELPDTGLEGAQAAVHEAELGECPPVAAETPLRKSPTPTDEGLALALPPSPTVAVVANAGPADTSPAPSKLVAMPITAAPSATAATVTDSSANAVATDTSAKGGIATASRTLCEGERDTDTPNSSDSEPSAHVSLLPDNTAEAQVRSTTKPSSDHSTPSTPPHGSLQQSAAMEVSCRGAPSHIPSTTRGRCTCCTLLHEAGGRSS